MSGLSLEDRASMHAAALRAVSSLLIPEPDLHLVRREDLQALIDLHAESFNELVGHMQEMEARQGREVQHAA